MTTALTSRKASTKVVHILARYQLKASGHVVYEVRSSKGDATYCTTIINGKATGCTCESRKPCYHMVQLEAREAQRRVQPSQEDTEPAFAFLAEGTGEYCPMVQVPSVFVDLRVSDLAEEREDEEYEQWKRANGWNEPMSREEYAAYFDVDGYAFL